MTLALDVSHYVMINVPCKFHGSIKKYREVISKYVKVWLPRKVGLTRKCDYLRDRLTYRHTRQSDSYVLLCFNGDTTLITFISWCMCTNKRHWIQPPQSPRILHPRYDGPHQIPRVGKDDSAGIPLFEEGFVYGLLQLLKLRVGVIYTVVQYRKTLCGKLYIVKHLFFV